MLPSDRRDFADFAKAIHPRTCRLARLLTGSDTEAADLAQSAYLKVAERWNAIDDPVAYLQRVLVNLAISRSRRKRRLRWVPLLDDDPAPDRAPTPSATGAWDQREELVAALRLLPTRQREVLVLRYVFDLTEQQTAHELGTTVGTVKSLGHRGLDRLRDIIPNPKLTTTRHGGKRVP